MNSHLQKNWLFCANAADQVMLSVLTGRAQTCLKPLRQLVVWKMWLPNDSKGTQGWPPNFLPTDPLEVLDMPLAPSHHPCHEACLHGSSIGGDIWGYDPRSHLLQKLPRCASSTAFGISLAGPCQPCATLQGWMRGVGQKRSFTKRTSKKMKEWSVLRQYQPKLRVIWYRSAPKFETPVGWVIWLSDLKMIVGWVNFTIILGCTNLIR